MIAKLAPIAAHLVFWSWNTVFISTVLFGVAPHVLVPLATEVRDGFVPLELALTALALTVVPLLITTLGALRLRHDPARLFALFYGVEAPIMLLLAVRLFLVRELTAATTYLFAVMTLGGLVFAYGVFAAERRRGRIAGASSVIAHSTCLATGGYLGGLLAFYALPAAAALVQGFFRFRWLGALAEGLRHATPGSALLLLLSFTLFAITASLFVLMPPAVVALYVGRFRRVVLTSPLGRGAAAALGGGALMALLAGYQVSNRQPQAGVLDRLDRTPNTDAERRALLADREAIRAGLLNAYLAPYRYWAPVESEHHMRELYTSVFGVSSEAAAGVEGVFHLFLRPFLYEAAPRGASPRGGLGDDRLRASAAYEAFFDAPIQSGERDAVLRALSATYDGSGREAGLLDAGARRVHLERQEVKITEHDRWADLELHEVYANQTDDQAEVLYLFSLPPSAVITGLWLGDDDRRERAFPFVVAPRGAAQAVYKAEVQRRVDPALLEQIGPRQYRLRAFPVPPRPSARRPAEGRPTRLHLWMTASVLAEDGAWPLPQLIERRNVYADRHTERVLDGGPLPLDDAEAWLPRAVPARTPLVRTPVSYALMPERAIRAEPLGGERPALAPGQRFAVVLDRSYSMGEHVDALAEAFTWLRDRVEQDHALDLYFSAGERRGESPARIDRPRGFDPRDVVYFGGQDLGGMLRDMAALRGDTRYTAVIVLTDGGSSALAKDAPRAPEVGGPLWVVHLGGRLAGGYDDGTLELIQSSGGGVATSLPEVFANLAYASTPGFVAVDGAYLWRVVPPSSDDATARDGFARMAGRQLLAEATRAPGPLPVEALDALHAVARELGMVTPYSSMLVLVNDEQREALRRAEAAADRFDREVESGTEALSTPTGGFPAVTATPEPEEWALIAVVAAGLGWIAVERRRRSGMAAV